MLWNMLQILYSPQEIKPRNTKTHPLSGVTTQRMQSLGGVTSSIISILKGNIISIRILLIYSYICLHSINYYTILIVSFFLGYCTYQLNAYHNGKHWVRWFTYLTSLIICYLPEPLLWNANFKRLSIIAKILPPVCQCRARIWSGWLQSPKSLLCISLFPYKD